MPINDDAIKSMRLTTVLISSLILSACGSSSDSSSASGDDVTVLPAQLPEEIGTPVGSSTDDESTELDDDSAGDESVEGDDDLAADGDDASNDDNGLVVDDGDTSNDEDVLAADDTDASEDDSELTANLDDTDEDDSGDEDESDDADADDSDEELVQALELPEEFTTVMAEAGAGIANTEMVAVQSAIGVQDPFVAQVFDFSTNDAATILGVKQFSLGANSSTNVDHYAVDVNTLAIDALYQTSADSSGVLSDDFSQLALSENCQAFTRRVDSGSAGTLVNQLTLADVCFTEARMSSNGDTAVFTAAPAALSNIGTTISSGGFSSDTGPVVVHRPTGTVTSLTLENISIPGTLTSVYNFSRAADIDISADGSTVAVSFQFVPNVRSELASVEVLTLILVVDAATGETTAVDQQFIEQLICSTCQLSSAFNLAVSDDGDRIISLRPSDDELTQLNAESALFVHSLSSGETLELALDDRVTEGTLAIDGAGTRVAFVNTDGMPVLLNLDSGERVDMDSAIRGCAADDADDCELTGYQFDSDAPLALNVDGNVLTMILVPDSTLPISEAFLLDTDTLQLDRLAANRPVSSITVDTTGEHVAYSGSDNTANGQNVSEIFLIRR